MAYSIKKFGLNGATLVQGILSRTKWTADLKRGLTVLRSGGLAVVDRSFAELELHRLRAQLEACDQKLDQCFQSLGKKSLAHWKNHQDIDVEEKERLKEEIDILKIERDRLLHAMNRLKKSDESRSSVLPETPTETS